MQTEAGAHGSIAAHSAAAAGYYRGPPREFGHVCVPPLPADADPDTPKPTKPEQTRDRGHSSASAVRAILDDPPLHIRPDLPVARVQSKQTVGLGHSGASMIASLVLGRYQIVLTSRQESVRKGLTYPLRRWAGGGKGSLDRSTKFYPVAQKSNA
jgi:hypothetical protein